MAIPVTPSSFTVYYQPDWYANVCDISASDSDDHQGFYVYRYDGASWILIQTINSTAAELVSEYIGGGESDLSQPHRITAFNTFGESDPLEWPITAQSDPVTDLQYTRNGASVDLIWFGDLVEGDSWTVRLIDPMGYNDVVTTTSDNFASVSVGVWLDRMIEVFSTQNPVNLSSIIIANNRPILSAPTLLSVTREGAYSTLIVDFNCDWLQSYYDEGFSAESATVYYSVAGDDSASFSNTVEVVAANHFRMMADVAPPLEGDEYQVTLDIDAINPYGGSSFGTSDRPAHVLANSPTSALLSLALSLIIGDSGVITPYVLSAQWETSGLPLALEIETRIDGSDWVSTTTTTGGTGEVSAWLHGVNDPYGLHDQTGPLDQAHGYVYSDGLEHTIIARARKSGSGDTWLLSETETLPLRSNYYPRIDWEINRPETNGVTWDAPFFAGDVPVNTMRIWSFTVDGIGNYVVSDAIAWLSIIPRDLLDGELHTIKFTAALTDNNEQLISSITMPERAVLMPLAVNLEIAEIDYITSIISVSSDGDYIVGVKGLNHNLIVNVQDGINPITYQTSDLDGTAIISNITLPRDGLIHDLLVNIHKNNVLTGFSADQTIVVPIATTMDRPPSPTGLVAELLRQATDKVVDQIRLTWPVNTHQIQIIAFYESRTRIIGYADSTDTEVIIEGIAKYLDKGSDMVPVRFGVRGYDIRSLGDIRLSNWIDLQSLALPPTHPPITPKLNESAFFQALFDDQDTDFSLPHDQVIDVVKTGLMNIKSILSQGGSVQLNMFGKFKTIWSGVDRRAAFYFDPSFKSLVANFEE
ncbi:MAG: hypothetical protein KDI50_03790 [Candidatus Competibacteraceae bacterium]|nr:hypothetical protein [Candidatus Competibacteraceae bacterium]